MCACGVPFEDIELGLDNGNAALDASAWWIH